MKDIFEQLGIYYIEFSDSGKIIKVNGNTTKRKLKEEII